MKRQRLVVLVLAAMACICATSCFKINTCTCSDGTTVANLYDDCDEMCSEWEDMK